MTENYPAPAPPQRGEPQAPRPAQDDHSTADVVKDQAADVGHSGVEAGKHAAEVASEEASGVVAEAGRQGRDLLRQAQDQVTEQAARGQQRAAGELLALRDDLRLMADRVDRNSPAGELARRAASRANVAGRWLDNRGPGQVLDEVQAFARRRPGMFLALAAGVGLLAGRMTRGMQAAASDGWSAATTEPDPGEATAPDAVPSYPEPTGLAAADQPRPESTL
jgi:hypothetical protein